MRKAVLLIALAGAAGGLVNALLDKGGLTLPAVLAVEGSSVLVPGFIGNVLVGAIAALISWCLYGPLADRSLIKSADPGGETSTAGGQPAAGRAGRCHPRGVFGRSMDHGRIREAIEPRDSRPRGAGRGASVGGKSNSFRRDGHRRRPGRRREQGALPSYPDRVAAPGLQGGPTDERRNSRGSGPLKGFVL